MACHEWRKTRECLRKAGISQQATDAVAYMARMREAGRSALYGLPPGHADEALLAAMTVAAAFDSPHGRVDAIRALVALAQSADAPRRAGVLALLGQIAAEDESPLVAGAAGAAGRTVAAM